MYKKILVPLDGSELTEGSLDYARAIADAQGAAEIVLLRVIELNPQVEDIGGVSSEPWYRDAQAKVQAEVKKYISTVANKLKKEGIAAEGIVTQGRTADEIVNCAKEKQVDLIVMTTHRRTGVSRWIHGSIADKVLHHSAVPMLIVPASCE